jgi:hypothetical protein
MSKPNEKRAYNSPQLRPVVLHASCTLFEEMLIEQAQEENNGLVLPWEAVLSSADTKGIVVYRVKLNPALNSEYATNLILAVRACILTSPNR